MVAAALAFEGYNEYATRVADDRRSCPRDDLMSILVHAEVDGDRLDLDSILQESLLVLIGGDETTRHVISGGAYQLLSERSRWEALRADPSGLTTAVEEMLRWVTPIKNMARTITHDLEFHGATAPRGRQGPAALPVGEPRRDGVRRPVHLRHRANAQRPRRIRRVRRPFLPGEQRWRGWSSRSCSSELSRGSATWSSPTVLSRRTAAANFVSGYETLPVTFSPSAPIGR